MRRDRIERFERAISEIVDEYEDVCDSERMAEDGIRVYELVEMIDDILVRLRAVLEDID
jgi:hypothetical protein